MKLKTLLLPLSFIVILLWAQCWGPELQEVTQPGYVEWGDTFDINITVVSGYYASALDTISPDNERMQIFKQEIIDDHNSRVDYFYRLMICINLWDTWEVIDSIPFYAIDTLVTGLEQYGYFIYSDSLTEEMEDIEPSMQNQRWWVGITADSMQFIDGTLWVDPQVMVDTGYAIPWMAYTIGYQEENYYEFFSVDYERFGGPIFSHPPDTCIVTNNNSSGAGSLRDRLDYVNINGVILFDLEEGQEIILDSSILLNKNVSIIAEKDQNLVISSALGPVFIIDTLNSIQSEIPYIKFQNLNISSSEIGIEGRVGKADLSNCTLSDNDFGLTISKYTYTINNCVFQNNQHAILNSNSNIYIDSSFVINNEIGYQSINGFNNFSFTTISGNSEIGLLSEGDDIVIFNSEYRNNIYANGFQKSGDYIAKDIYSTKPLEIILDTFSVLNPNVVFVFGNDSNIYDIHHGYYEQHTQDIYVSVLGDDNNTGLTEDDPFCTLGCALSHAINDPETPVKIHITGGEFAIGRQIIPENISIEGNFYNPTSIIGTGFWYYKPNNNELKNVSVSSLMTTDGNMKIKNCSFEGAPIGIIAENCQMEVRSSTFMFCDTAVKVISDSEPSSFKTVNGKYVDNGIGIYASGNEDIHTDVTIIGSLFTHNIGVNTIYTSNNTSLEIINSTISDNLAGSPICQNGNTGTLFVQNSIIYGNADPQIAFEGNASVYFSNIEGGWEGYGNIDEDPLFDTDSDRPYSLLFNSPCVDAGNTDTTGLNIHIHDLAKNPRIWNNRIDMGAYEWNSLGATENQVNNGVSLFPNPTTDRLTIEFETDIKSDVNIELYNLQGVKTKTWHYSNISQSTYNIDLSELETGVYTIVIVTVGTILAEKIIVM